MIPIYSYQTQEVRDLAWACFSPSLLLTQALLTQKSADDEQNITECGLARTPLRQASTNETASHWNEWLGPNTKDRRSIYGYLILPRAQWLSAARTGIDTALCQEELLRKLYHQLTTDWRPQLVAGMVV